MANKYGQSVAQNIRGLSRAPSFGQALGTGISEGLSSLLEGQLGQMLQRRQRKATTSGLEQLLGVAPEQAASMAQMPPDLLKTIVPQIQKNMQMQKVLEQYKQSNQSRGNTIEEVQEDSVVTDQEKQGLANENDVANRAFEQAFLLSNGNTAVALRAESDARKRMQRGRIAEEKKSAMLSREKEKRITSALGEARKEAKEVQSRIESSRGSIDAYKNIRRLLKAGKPVTGLPMRLLKHFGIDKSVTGWETQLMDKVFAGEPIRALRSLPPQAARLSKVFDTLKDMHGSLLNTKAGIDAIARSKIVEAKAAKAIDKNYIKLLESYRKKGQEPPFDIREKAAKGISEKLNKYGAEVQYIISDSIEKAGAPLKEYKVGELIISDDGSGQVFKKEKLFGKNAWVEVGG